MKVAGASSSHVQKREQDAPTTLCFSGFADGSDIKGAAILVFEGLDGGGDFDDGVTDGFDAEAGVGAGKQFAFDDAAGVAEGEELHGPSIGLAVSAVGEDHPGEGDRAVVEIAEPGDRAIRFPCDVGKYFERMTGDGEAEEFHFITEAFGGLGLCGWKGEGGRCQIKEGGFSATKEQPAGLPKLLHAGLSKTVKSSPANETLHLRNRRPGSQIKVPEGLEGLARVPARQQGRGKAFDLPQRNANTGGRFQCGSLIVDALVCYVISIRGEIHVRGQKGNAEAAAFDGIGEAVVEAFAVGKNGRQKFGWVITF